MLKARGKAEKEAAEILAKGGEHDELTQTLRGATTGLLAKAIRLKVPIGDTGEKVAQAFLEAGVTVAAGQAVALRSAIQNRLQARMKPAQYRLFLNPHEQLAQALAEGLERVGRDRPLLVFLDTYEIVGRADTWLRETMKAAGPRLLWVIAGRDDLVRSRPFGPDASDYFHGYGEEFPRRLLAYDMRQLALDDLRAYFADAAPERPVDGEAVLALSRATRGIPLAIRVAAELWARGLPLDDIVGGLGADVPHREIVEQMTGRYLLHAVSSADREALYALALARGDLELLAAMLRPADTPAFDLAALLRRLRRDYAAVHLEEARLHDDPAGFIIADLKTPEKRVGPAVRRLQEQAAAALQARLQRLEAEMPLIEERSEDGEWAQAVLALAETLFWLDEQRAWRWLIPRYVEGLAYSRDLRRGLANVAGRWHDYLDQRSRQRLKKLQAAESFLPDLEAEATLLNELERLSRPAVGWLGGEGEGERQAILYLRRGELSYRQKEYQAALAWYEKAEANLPAQGEILKGQLGEAMYNLAGAFMWPEERRDAIYTPEAERLLPKVVQWLPDKQGAWYRLGVILSLTEKYTEAIAAYRQAIALDPKLAYPHHGLGNVYKDLGRYEEATAAYQQAIALDAKLAYPHNGLGNVYDNLGQYEEAIAAYRQAIALDAKYASPHHNLADTYMKMRQFEKARYHFQERVRLEPETALGALVGLGVLARQAGDAESEQYFHQALARCERAWQARYQSEAGSLENKALALLGLGRPGEALATLQQALACRLPGDTIDLEYYELLAEAPQPPAGLAALMALLRQEMGAGAGSAPAV